MRVRVSSQTIKLMLAAAVLIQGIILVTDFALPLQARLRTVAGRSMLERGARLSFGDRFFEYIQFVRTNVPESGRVVIPPTSIDSTYGNQGIMQFFLFPRSITNCPEANLVDECLETFRGESTYFLYIQGFPAEEIAGRTRELVLYDGRQGFYKPPD